MECPDHFAKLQNSCGSFRIGGVTAFRCVKMERIVAPVKAVMRGEPMTAIVALFGINSLNLFCDRVFSRQLFKNVFYRGTSIPAACILKAFNTGNVTNSLKRITQINSFVAAFMDRCNIVQRKKMKVSKPGAGELLKMAHGV